MILLFLLISTAQAEPYRFVFQADKTYTTAEKAMLKRIERKANEITSAPCFESWFLSTAKRSKLDRTNGRTRAEVLNHLQTATAHIRFTMYYTSKRVIGYRTKGSNLVHTNAKYYRKTRSWDGQLCPRLSNALHETAHVLEYGHDFKRTKRRPYSVPYTAGSAVTFCCEEE